MTVSNFKAIPIVVEMFPSGAKCWKDKLTDPEPVPLTWLKIKSGNVGLGNASMAFIIEHNAIVNSHGILTTLNLKCSHRPQKVEKPYSAAIFWYLCD